MNTWLAGLGCLAVAIGLFTGCGSGAPRLSSNQAAAFGDAPPELKHSWEKALAADKANDYSAAASALFRLLGQQLTPEQNQAVQSAIVSLNHRMYAAAEKGDAQAIKALEESKVLTQRR